MPSSETCGMRIEMSLQIARRLSSSSSSSPSIGGSAPRTSSMPNSDSVNISTARLPHPDPSVKLVNQFVSRGLLSHRPPDFQPFYMRMHALLIEWWAKDSPISASIVNFIFSICLLQLYVAFVILWTVLYAIPTTYFWPSSDGKSVHRNATKSHTPIPASGSSFFANALSWASRVFAIDPEVTVDVTVHEKPSFSDESKSFTLVAHHHIDFGKTWRSVDLRTNFEVMLKGGKVIVKSSSSSSLKRSKT